MAARYGRRRAQARCRASSPPRARESKPDRRNEAFGERLQVGSGQSWSRQRFFQKNESDLTRSNSQRLGGSKGTLVGRESKNQRSLADFKWPQRHSERDARKARGNMDIKRIVQSGVNSLERQLFQALLNVSGSTTDIMPFLKFCARNMDNAHAQLFQDLLVLFLLEEKRDGYFVEFGAMDGVKLSNTYLLENKYGWRGIVAEPARCWHQELIRNRRCSADHRCVWSQSGETLQFNETTQAEYSTIDALSGSDMHAKARQDGKRYAVETISLCDLLRAHDAPRNIDYLFIDTEGSEFAILDSFFPSEYEIRIITVEHNYTTQQSQILLTSSGYDQILKELSMWDSWYIKQ